MRITSTLAILLLGALVLGGCSRVRFIVDAVPAEDELTETVVLDDPGTSSRSPKVALVDVTGLLLDARRPGLLAAGENPVSEFLEALEAAESDDDVEAVLVRINSPGGAVTATAVMYRELLSFKARTGRPVVVLMGDVAASGGFYLACAADEIVAHPTSVTGSIGVIIQTINFSEGMRRIGIRADSITSGPNKSMGSPLEPMSEEHRALLQGIVDEFYDGFVAVVTEHRAALAASDVGWVTDGRVVTGRRAAEIGLVDATGDLRSAFAAAKRRAGIESARLVKYHRPTEHVGSAYASSPPAAPSVSLLEINVDGPLLDRTGFYYLWDPTAW